MKVQLFSLFLHCFILYEHCFSIVIHWFCRQTLACCRSTTIVSLPFPFSMLSSPNMTSIVATFLIVKHNRHRCFHPSILFSFPFLSTFPTQKLPFVPISRSWGTGLFKFFFFYFLIWKANVTTFCSSSLQ